MEKSNLRGHFHMFEESGQRTATCIHCKKGFGESKSTGNLWKHIEDLHPFEFKARSSYSTKKRTLDSFGIKEWSLSLPLPDAFIVTYRKKSRYSLIVRAK